MIEIKVRGIKEIEKQLASVPAKAARAAVVALNKTGKAIKEEVVAEMKRVFDRPTRYTLNSLQLDPATKQNLTARVWFKQPARMGAHYLVSQVEGGQRKDKGFERALGERFIPGKFARMTAEGNVSPGQIRQILSVMGKAEASAGYSANLTARSAKRNTRDRDYVFIRRQHGRLWPGIYQRFQTGAGFGAKTKGTIGRFGAWQRGNRKVAVRDPLTGRIIRWETPKNNRIQSIVRAKGLRPIMLKGRRGVVKPLLPFYDIAQRVADERLARIFRQTLEEYLRS